MSRGWLSECVLLSLFLAGGVAVGAAINAPGPSVIVALVGWLAFRVRDLLRFERWLQHSIGRPPRLSGVVEELAFRTWRQRGRARARSRRLARMLRQLQTSTDALPDAAVLLEGHDTIVWYNRTASRMLGLQRRDVGHAFSGLLRSPGLQRMLQGAAEDDFVETPSPVDDRVTLDIRLIPFGDQQQLVLARDVSQVAQLRTMRQDFIANVSHELRTPLTVILGYLEALDDEDDLQSLRGTLRRLQRPASRMKSLVEDLLLLSRLDSAVAPDPDELTSIDVASLMRRIVADASDLSGGRHDFVTDVDSTVRLLGIDQELHSAFANLVINAVRYSPDGGRIHIRWQDLGNGDALFSVQDEGLGVAPEHIPRLTERFYRVDVGRSREAGGTGLGLAIAKHVLRRHGSELDIRSALNEGSTFSCAFHSPFVQRATVAAGHDSVTNL